MFSGTVCVAMIVLGGLRTSEGRRPISSNASKFIASDCPRRWNFSAFTATPSALKAGQEAQGLPALLSECLSGTSDRQQAALSSPPPLYLESRRLNADAGGRPMYVRLSDCSSSSLRGERAFHLSNASGHDMIRTDDGGGRGATSPHREPFPCHLSPPASIAA